MGSRLVLLWTALSVVAYAITRGVFFTFSALGLSIGDPTSELLIVVLIVATPLTQWLALRAAGLRWGREWAFATMAGGIFASVVLSIVQWLPIGVGFGPLSSVAYSVASAAATVLLQWAVLRRRAARAAAWLVTGAAVWVLERGVYRLVTGEVVAGPGPATLPISTEVLLSTMVALSIVVAAALVESLALVWIVLRPAQGAALSPERSPGRGWLWLEWTTASAVGLLTIMGASGLIDNLFRGQPGAGAAIGRPLFAAFAGAVIGAVQWLLLRTWLGLSPIWIAVSAAALSIPALAIFIPLLGLLVFFGWLMAMRIPGGMILVGAWFGMCQWLVLRRYARRSSAWIPATAFAWGMFHLTRDPVSLSIQTVGLAAGAISGLALFALVPAGHDNPRPTAR